jgi:hypothetical protein
VECRRVDGAGASVGVRLDPWCVGDRPTRRCGGGGRADGGGGGRPGGEEVKRRPPPSISVTIAPSPTASRLAHRDVIRMREIFYEGEERKR